MYLPYIEFGELTMFERTIMLMERQQSYGGIWRNTNVNLPYRPSYIIKESRGITPISPIRVNRRYYPELASAASVALRRADERSSLTTSDSE